MYEESPSTDFTQILTLKETYQQPTSTAHPKLQFWTEVVADQQIAIKGFIVDHPGFPDGLEILTSSIQSVSTDAQGREFAITKNSRYELCQPIHNDFQYEIYKLKQSLSKLKPKLGKETMSSSMLVKA